MAKQKEKKQTPVSRLMEYAGSFQYLAVASWVLAAVSAFVALVPFYFIWRLIKEVYGLPRIMVRHRICLPMAGVQSVLQSCLC